MTLPPPLAVLADRIARLEDMESIRQLVSAYGIAADRGNDPVMFDRLLTRDAIWEAEGFGRYEGAGEIVTALAAIGRDSIKWSLHYMVSPLIEIDAGGERATCKWYLWELARIADNAGGTPAHWIGGCYDTTVIREAGGWRFQHITLNIRLLSEYKEGWSELP